VTFTVLFSGPCNPLLGTPESLLCLNNIAVSQAVLNIVTDGVIILLPIPTIHALHMPLKQRITVGCILALGSAACIASIVRVAYVRAMVENPDFTFTQCSAAVWSLLEMNLGILCNSLAALKPFARRHLPSWFSRTGSNGGGTGPSGGGGGMESDSYAKRSKNGAAGGGATGGGSKSRWGHSYQLHSIGNGKTETSMTTTTTTTAKAGSSDSDKEDGVVVTDQFSVEYARRHGHKAGSTTTANTGKGDSTDSILAIQYPAHQPV